MPDAVVSVDFDPETEVLSIHLWGEIDVASAPALRAELLPQLRRRSAARLVVLLDEVTFFGAEGMRLLHDLRERSVSPLDVRCAPGRPARRVLDLFHGELVHR